MTPKVSWICPPCSSVSPLDRRDASPNPCGSSRSATAATPTLRRSSALPTQPTPPSTMQAIRRPSAGCSTPSYPTSESRLRGAPHGRRKPEQRAHWTCTCDEDLNDTSCPRPYDEPAARHGGATASTHARPPR